MFVQIHYTNKSTVIHHWSITTKPCSKNIAYSHWTKTYDKSPLMTIDATKYDFVKNIEDTRHVLNSVYDQLFFYNKISPAKLHELREKTKKLTKDDIPITD